MIDRQVHETGHLIIKLPRHVFYKITSQPLNVCLIKLKSISFMKYDPNLRAIQFKHSSHGTL